MKLISAFVAKWTTPVRLTPEAGVRYWQERVLLILLLFSTVLGFVTWVPSVTLAFKEELWPVVVLDTLMLGFIVTIFWRRDLPYIFRAAAISVISYILGAVLVAVVGPFGAGPVWLFFFPVLTAVLLGKRSAMGALVLNLLTIIAIGVLIRMNKTELLGQFHFKTWHLAAENPVEKWVVICFNFMLLNILATLSVTTILNGLQNSLQRTALSEKKHRRIFENILDVYFETSFDGTILEVSPSVKPLSGYSPAELKGTSIFKVYETPGERHSLIRELIRHGQVDDYEVLFKDKKGGPRACSIKARLVNDETGSPERIIGIFRDMSEQKAMAQKKQQLEERLNRSQKMEALGLLAGGVAHDLNNVLSGIVTYPDLLLEDLAPDHPMRDPLEVIRASGLRATEIVQDLLTLSRRGVMKREVVDLNGIISEFLKTPEYETLMSLHPGIAVETKLAATVPLVNGSLVHLQKTLMNLVSNAAEAQADGGHIGISTENRSLEKPVPGYDRVKKGRYIVLSVADHGMGIAPEDMKRIFEPFFTKKAMGRSGTGLGMAVVWGTVQDHDGYIDLTSEPGRGTRFDLYFPVTREPKNNTSPQAQPLDRLMGRGEKILVVDDVANQREIAGRILERLGYTPVSLPSGEDAVAYLKTNEADLVILDMIMTPGIDGLETFRRIRSFKPVQKAIIASGYSKSDKVDEALRLGAGRYVRKPYSLEEIGSAVRSALARGTTGHMS